MPNNLVGMLYFKTHVKFNRKDEILNNVGLFFQKFTRKYGVNSVLTYKGNILFMVNLINEYMTEIEYDPLTYAN